MSFTRMLGHVDHNRIHVGVVVPKAAKELFFVSRYDRKDPASNAIDQHGYQRPPTEDRFSKIAEYYRQNGNRYLITPIIVSVRLAKASEIEKFIKLFGAGDIAAIKRTFGDSVMSVVDGQHRSLGLIDAWETDSEFVPNIPVMLYFGMSFIEEAELFSIINATQRKLPKALIETTKGDITEVGSNEYNQKIRRIAFALCRDQDSVWGLDQINMTGVRDADRPVTYEGLRRSTMSMFPTELLERLEGIDAELPIKMAKRYWKAVSEACHEAWTGTPATRVVKDPATGEKVEMVIKYRIKDLVGVASLAKLGKDIIISQLEAKKDPTRLTALVDRLSEVDWEKDSNNKWMKSQAGFAGQKELYLALHKHVYSEESEEAELAGAEA